MTLGIRVREDKIEEYKQNHDLMSKVYDKFLVDYSD